jgi:hypothetical protein
MGQIGLMNGGQILHTNIRFCPPPSPPPPVLLFFSIAHASAFLKVSQSFPALLSSLFSKGIFSWASTVFPLLLIICKPLFHFCSFHFSVSLLLVLFRPFRTCPFSISSCLVLFFCLPLPLVITLYPLPVSYLLLYLSSPRPFTIFSTIALSLPSYHPSFSFPCLPFTRQFSASPLLARYLYLLLLSFPCFLSSSPIPVSFL